MSRRRRIVIWSLSAVAILVVAVVAVVGVFLQGLADTFDDQRNVIELDRDDAENGPTSSDEMNVLILGDVLRDHEEEAGQTHGRSNTMMLMHVPEDRSGIYVMSIMRDLFVEIPGHGEGRINSALPVGGPELAIQTVEDLLDTHIDHVLVIDFDGFESMTEALGGVYVDNPRPFSAGQRNPTFFPEGVNRLEGSEALRFVQERKTFSDGDHSRVQNQQLLVEAIMDRFLSTDTLTSPQRVTEVVESIAPYLSMDEGLDSQRLFSYVLEVRDLRSEDLEFFTVPVGEPSTTAAGAQVLLPDHAALSQLQGALQQGTLDDYLPHLDEELPEEIPTTPADEDSPAAP